VLVVYAAWEWPLRASARDHLYCFRDYADRPCVYFNAQTRRPARWLRRCSFDAVVFHTSFLSLRWNPAVFGRLKRRAADLRTLAPIAVVMPQDEFLHTDALCGFIEDLRVDHVLTCAPDTEWSKIYGPVLEGRRFTTVLTGYLSDRAVSRVADLAKKEPTRQTDIGYRAWRAMPWLGRLGYLKGVLADEVQTRGPELGLRTDISVRPADTLSGDDWYRFLLRCKYTIGVDSGASILDHDGSIKRATETYIATHPDADFDTVEEACFPGRDGELNLSVISPRHLEACLTRTGQLLVEADYSGVLQPGEHYIPIRRDLANLDDVLTQARADHRRADMTERAFRDVVASGSCSYRGFVRDVLEGEVLAAGRGDRQGRLLSVWSNVSDAVSWCPVIVKAVARRIVTRAAGPERLGPVRARVV
jgi:hypothetical protein